MPAAVSRRIGVLLISPSFAASFLFCRPAAPVLTASGSFRDASQAVWLESSVESSDKQVLFILRNRSDEAWEHCRIDIDLPSGSRFAGTAAGRLGPGARAPVSGPTAARPPSGFLDDFFSGKEQKIKAYCVQMEKWPVVSVSYAVTERTDTGLVIRGTLRNDSPMSAELPVVEGVLYSPDGKPAGYGQGYSSRGRFFPGQASVLAVDVDVFPESVKQFQSHEGSRFTTELFVSMERAAD